MPVNQPASPDTCQPGKHTARAQPLDALIVGQGIAGSLLGYALHQRGLRVRVIDEGHTTSASAVAAGMINPVQGRRLNTIWQIEQCLPAAIQMYEELATRFRRQFFFPRRILKLLRSQAEADFLQKRLQDPAFSPWLGTVYPPGSHRQTAQHNPSCTTAQAPLPADQEAQRISDTLLADAPRTSDTLPSADVPRTSDALPAPNTLCDPFGSFEITGGGYLDTPGLLGVLRDFFRTEGLLIETHFDHADLDLSLPALLGWQDCTARRILFAEGWRVLHNPFFADYGFLPTKGQILTVQSAAPLPQAVLNAGKWLVPQAEREAWIGATFERGRTDLLPSAEAEAEILSDVQSLIPANALRVLSARAGVRLAATDYIPRAGLLRTDSRIGLFCAFSSKGNSLAPWLAQRMADLLTNGTPLPAAVDIAA